MLVSRRNAIKRLVLVSAGAALLPACVSNPAKPATTTRNFQLSGDQQQQLQELTAMIIPSGATPGAREAAAHVFVLRMLDDCYSKDDRDKFLRGFATYLQTAPAQRTALLTALETKSSPDESLNFFYATTKKLTIQAYTSSKYYLTNVQVYELVPGRWHGCVPVKPTKA